MSKILPGAGPFYYKGNEIGVIIIHGGGGGTCADLKPIAEDIHEKAGYTISVPLLPGYGTTPEELRNTPIKAWKSALEKEIKELKRNCEKIFIGGHSMGGVLTLILASKQDFDGIFTISAPIDLKGFIHHLVPFFKLFIKFYPIEADKFRKETDNKWGGYEKIPVNIAIKIKNLMKEMYLGLQKVKCPALILQGRHDSVIKDNSMDVIYNQINSKSKKKVWLENNDHPILDSPDQRLIISELLIFIKENIS